MPTNKRPRFRLPAVSIILLTLFVLSCGEDTAYQTRQGPEQRHPASKVETAAEKVEKVAAQVLDWALTLHPDSRLQMNLPVTKIPDLTYAQAQQDARFARDMLKTLTQLQSEQLSREDWLTVEFIQAILIKIEEGVPHYWLKFVVTPYTFSNFTSGIHRAFSSAELDNAKDLKNYLSLAEEYADMLDQMLDKLKGQARRGIRLPKAAIPKVRKLFTDYALQTEAKFGVTAERLAGIKKNDADVFQDTLNRLLADRIKPGFQAIAAYLGGDYVNAAPEAAGLGQYEGGKDFYRYLVKLHTTLALSPEQVHGTGLRRVAEISAKLEAIRKELGFMGGEKAFNKKLRTLPYFIAKTPREMERRYLGFIKRFENVADRYFTNLPKAPYGVQRLPEHEEASATFGYYRVPSADQNKGIYFYNASALENRPMISVGEIIYHELIPGHHFHLAKQFENKSLPLIRRLEFYGYHPAFHNTAFTEGWAVYSSALAEEAGMYGNPYDLYGRHVMEKFFAARLVIDTGIHYYGWSLKKARDYMRDNLLLSEAQIESESLRYSTDLPGQALAYRIGLEKIMALRNRIETESGREADLRDFHEVILDSGTLPLKVLEKKVTRFIAPQADH